MGGRHNGDTQMTFHRRRATKMPRFERPKAGKKANNKKKKGEERGKRKGRAPGLGHQVNN
jgi:hypothetical protein